MRIRVQEGRLVLDASDRLTAEQVGALVADREVAVSAGAGAGKTTTLASRFVTLLQRELDAAPDGPPDIQSVLVLTFTDRATQEMRERCYAAVAEVARTLRTDAGRLRAEGLPDAELLRLRHAWESLRDRFPGAAISTFHSFCLRVLGEFPAETGTPPGTRTLDGDEANAHQARVVEETLDRRALAGDEDLPALLRTFGGRAGLVDVARELLAHRDEVRQDLEAARQPEVFLRGLLQASPVPAEAARAFLHDEWAPWARAWLAVARQEETRFAAALAGVLRELDKPGDGFDWLDRYAQALAPLDTERGLPDLVTHSRLGSRAQRGGPVTEGEKAILAELTDRMSAWAGRVAGADTLPNRHDRALAPLLAALGRLLEALTAGWQAHLAATGTLDFTELLLRVHAAFARRDALLDELRRRHRYVMVDEFQDTDALQWDIVRALARPEGAPRDRLFFVGDLKQAIYGFRGGDVEVFAAASREVVDEGGGALVTLSRNHRSRPGLLHTFNSLFEGLLGPPRPARPAWEASFAPLTPGRTEADRVTPATGGTTHVLLHGEPKAEAAAALEAAWVAHLVADELLAGVGAYAGLELADTVRHPTPPIALLVRTRTRLDTFEQALRERGVAYLVVGGVGFWSRPEVRDVVNVLVALAREDAVALAGALRSPLFALTDPELRRLARAEGLPRFGLDPLPIAALEDAATVAAHTTWSGLRAAARRRSVAGLVEAIVEGTHEGWVQGVAEPEGRGLANVDRLLVLADAHDRAGGTLDAFVTALLGHVDEEARQAEATLSASTARVAITTVHASKGLEFPVVILPLLGARDMARAPTLRRQRMEGGWELAFKVPDDAAPVESLAAPGRLCRLEARAAAMAEAESRRLLYVACTRARDHLLMIGPREPGGKETWAHWIGTWLGPDPRPESLTRNPSHRPPDASGAGSAPTSITGLGPAHSAGTPPTSGSASAESVQDSRSASEPWLQVTLVDDSPPAPAGPLVPVDRGPPPPLTWVAPVPSAGTIEVPPSSLELAGDPEEWRRVFVYGFPEAVPTRSAAALKAAAPTEPPAAPPAPTTPPGTRDAVARARRIASVRGDVIHTLIEEEAIDDDALARRRWEAFAREAGVDEADLDLGWRAVVRQLATLRGSEACTAILRARGFRELPVRLVRGRLVLNGRLDLLCRDPVDGAWMVVDYKTVRDPADTSALLDRYRLQLLAYSEAASHVLTAHGGPPVARAAVLLTANGTVVRLPDWQEADRVGLFARLDRLSEVLTSTGPVTRG